MVPSDWSFNCRNPKRKNMSPHKHCELYISKIQLYSILLPYVFVFYIKYHRLQFPFSLVSKRLKYVLLCLLFCFERLTYRHTLVLDPYTLTYFLLVVYFRLAF